MYSRKKMIGIIDYLKAAGSNEAFSVEAYMDITARFILNDLGIRIPSDFDVYGAINVLENFVRANEEGYPQLIDAWHTALSNLDKELNGERIFENERLGEHIFY